MVHVDLETHEPVSADQIDQLADAGPGADASMALLDQQLGFTWTVAGADPLEAGERATKGLDGALTAAGVVVARQVNLEIVAVDEMDRRLAEPTIQPLVGASEAAELLAVSRQRVHQLAADNPRFPVPVVSVRMGPLWTKRSIEAFAEGWSRKPGRPAVVKESESTPQVGGPYRSPPELAKTASRVKKSPSRKRPAARKVATKSSLAGRKGTARKRPMRSRRTADR